jgi:hypothetical protein
MLRTVHLEGGPYDGVTFATFDEPHELSGEVFLPFTEGPRWQPGGALEGDYGFWGPFDAAWLLFDAHEWTSRTDLVAALATGTDVTYDLASVMIVARYVQSYWDRGKPVRDWYRNLRDRHIRYRYTPDVDVDRRWAVLVNYNNVQMWTLRAWALEHELPAVGDHNNIINQHAYGNEAIED